MGTRSPRAWRRSWMLGYISAVIARVRAAEDRAVRDADTREETGRPSTAHVLADRTTTVRHRAQEAYPRTRNSRITHSAGGSGAGYREGQNTASSCR
jgi:hypothetical protein